MSAQMYTDKRYGEIFMQPRLDWMTATHFHTEEDVMTTLNQWSSTIMLIVYSICVFNPNHDSTALSQNGAGFGSSTENLKI